MAQKINPFEKFGLYYKPTKVEFLTYYQQDLRRITLNLLSKRYLKLEPSKVEDFLQELNLKIAFRKNENGKPSRLERYDPFRNLKKQLKINSSCIVNYVNQEEFARCISFKTYLYTIVRNYVSNKVKQEAANRRRVGISIDSNPDDPQLFIVNNSVNNYRISDRLSKIKGYLNEFEEYLTNQCAGTAKNISLLTVWKCIKQSSRNKEIVKMLREKFPGTDIKNTTVTRYLRKIRDHAQKFKHTVGALEL